jgi:hypothetical protein
MCDLLRLASLDIVGRTTREGPLCLTVSLTGRSLSANHAVFRSRFGGEGISQSGGKLPPFGTTSTSRYGRSRLQRVLEQKLPNGRMLMLNGGQVAFEDSAVLNFTLFESMHRDNI